MFDVVKEMKNLNRTTVSLKFSFATLNHKFYQDLVLEFYRECQKRHPKFPVVRRMSFGVALCRMPLTQEQYLMVIDASARRNYKKSIKKGYDFRKIDYNDHLDEIWEIRKSADVRQGKVDPRFLEKRPKECRNPKSKSNMHDYPYYGVFSPSGKLVAYAGCFICGEIAMIEHIYGHKEYEKDRVVPRLIIDIGNDLYRSYPNSFNYAYGTYFGAKPEMRRFKKKFNFLPHFISWKL